MAYIFFALFSMMSLQCAVPGKIPSVYSIPMLERGGEGGGGWGAIKNSIWQHD